MNKIIVAFTFAEFVIGVGFTIWFAMKKIIFPVIDFIVAFLSTYDEFLKWRRNRNA